MLKRGDYYRHQSITCNFLTEAKTRSSLSIGVLRTKNQGNKINEKPLDFDKNAKDN